MPMLDVTIPEGALAPEAERALIAQLTDLLIAHEGADPASPRVRAVSWVFLHRPAAVFVGGAPEEAPHYRVVPTVPEGQYDDERRQAVVADVTEAILDAEDGAHPRDPSRIWVFPTEMPEGTWGSNGRINRLADIADSLFDVEDGQRYAQERLGGRAVPSRA
jgi:phenylpyruvate tautomerase PptA (4-oxalocrotonate tautomerase family)